MSEKPADVVAWERHKELDARLHPKDAEAFQQIDAMVMSSDCLCTPDGCDQFAYWLKRWRKTLDRAMQQNRYSRT